MIPPLLAYLGSVAVGLAQPCQHAPQDVVGVVLEGHLLDVPELCQLLLVLGLRGRFSACKIVHGAQGHGLLNQLGWKQVGLMGVGVPARAAGTPLLRWVGVGWVGVGWGTPSLWQRGARHPTRQGQAGS